MPLKACWRVAPSYPGAVCIAVALVLVFLNSMGWFLATPIPAFNARPSDYLHLSGSVPDGFAVQIVARYATTNPRYQVSVNWLEDYGAYRQRIVHIDIPIQETSGRYEATIPLDRFLPGNADWTPDGIDVLLRASGQSPLRLIQRSIQARGSPPLGYVSSSN